MSMARHSGGSAAVTARQVMNDGQQLQPRVRTGVPVTMLQGSQLDNSMPPTNTEHDSQSLAAQPCSA